MNPRRLQPPRRLTLCALAMALLFAPGLTCGAATTPQLAAPDVNAFLDGFVPESIARGDIAGATIAVVKDGKVLTIRNYGYADVAKRRPVGDLTMFRPGSISKLFTWTAVMQQVERGHINLDRDVNDYLDFKIPPAYGRPITMRNLMTHTSGFEETIDKLFVANAGEMVPLDVYLKAHIPRRIFPPGTTVAYSNYGAALAGYIVQRVSGMPYDAYIEENIFKPLGMNHSTMRQPVPHDLAPLLSLGYAQASGEVIPFEYVQAWPAGSLSSTSGDMAKFMIAHLQNGQLGSARILKPQTARLMHSFERRDAPGLNGFDLGFYQENYNGQPIIGHAGDTNAFHSDLHLMLKANVGLFMSFNSAGKNGVVGELRTDLFHAFLNRYFPETLPNEPTSPTAAADARLVAGSYESSRRENDAFAVLFTLTEANVAANPDGTIAISELKTPAGQLKRFREVGPLVFREVGGPGQVIFVRNANGIDYFATDAIEPVFIFQRVPWWKEYNFLKVVLIGTLGILIVTVLLWPIAALIRRYYRRPISLPPTAARLRVLARIACVIALLATVAWLAVVTALGKASVPGVLMGCAYTLSLLCVFGAVVLIANAIVAWRTPGRGIIGKIGETLPAIAGIAFAWLVLAFGLANFNFHY